MSEDKDERESRKQGLRDLGIKKVSMGDIAWYESKGRESIFVGRIDRAGDGGWSLEQLREVVKSMEFDARSCGIEVG